MTKEEFYQHACLNAIRILKSGYWDVLDDNDKGVEKVVDFARKLTDKVFDGKTYIDIDKAIKWLDDNTEWDSIFESPSDRPKSVQNLFRKAMIDE